jgi:hypothetical protein
VGNPHRLTSPLLEVTMADGAVLTVQTANPDLLLYERTAAKHKWRPMTEAPLTWITFLSWAALRREDQIPRDLTWEAYSEQALHITDVSERDDDTDDPGAGDPTRPGPGPG